MLRKLTLKAADVLLQPAVHLAAILMKKVRTSGLYVLPRTKRILNDVGVLPVIRQYYEPLISEADLRQPLNKVRELPGLDLNIDGQWPFLRKLSVADELRRIPREKIDGQSSYMNNEWFGSGDAEYWYSLIRLVKPQKIIEVGGGYSTLIAREAIKKNEEEQRGYRCVHMCIQPFRNQWLGQSAAQVLREKVENLDPAVFAELQNNDVLFIDSSHIIRPQGDVLFEYLNILPKLSDGVIVRIHDVFTPRDYLKHWVTDLKLLWNKQYLLEAFLTQNRNWRVLGALNFLHHDFFPLMSEKFPHPTADCEPGSF